jgi:hypothetical protein
VGNGPNPISAQTSTSGVGSSLVVLLVVAGIVAIGCGILCGYIAHQKGRDSVGWGLLSLFLPLIALLALVALPPIGVAAVGGAGGVAQCPNRHAVVPGAAFCPTCGEAMTRTCSNGHAVPLGAVFCAACGERMRPEDQEQQGTVCTFCQRPMPAFPRKVQHDWSGKPENWRCGGCKRWNRWPEPVEPSTDA